MRLQLVNNFSFIEADAYLADPFLTQNTFPTTADPYLSHQTDFYAIKKVETPLFEHPAQPKIQLFACKSKNLEKIIGA